MSRQRFPNTNLGSQRRGPSSPSRVCRRPLPARDSAILLALDQYRYLDREQVTELFFRGRRQAQLRLEQLATRGLIHCWARNRSPSVYALTTSGARHVARLRAEDPRPIIERARRSREQTYHLRHDLEANGVFVKLAAGGRHLADQGLYHWLGENACRAAREREGSPPSDGWGRYLLADREITFDLEWDRGTEHAGRIRQKASGYVAYFRGRRDAERHQVLFVAPTGAREGELNELIESVMPRHVALCRFWTTTVDHYAEHGLLAAVWLEIGGTGDRVAFGSLPGLPRSARATGDCIAKPFWWERRPGGGEGA